MDAVVMIVALEAAEQLARRPIRLAVAVLVLEDQDVRRLAHVDRLPNTVRVWQDRNAERCEQIWGLVKNRDLVRLADAFGVFQDQDAVPFLAIERPAPELGPIVDRLAHPDTTLVVDVDA